MLVRSHEPDNLITFVSSPQERREAKDLERLERHGRAAALASQASEAEQPNGKQDSAEQRQERNEINGQQARTLAKELNRDNESGDAVKQARIREIAERFKEKAARDREQERSFSR